MEKEVQEKRNFNKYIAIIAIVLVIAALIVVLLSVFNKEDKKEKFEEGEECKIVRNFISAMNNKNSSEAEICMDFTGTEAWGYHTIRNFSEDDYSEFINDYENAKGYEVQQEREYFKMNLEKQLNKVSKIEVNEMKSVDKLGKDLYVVEAEIYLQKISKKEDDSDTLSNSNGKYNDELQEMLEEQEKLEKEYKELQAKLYGISLDKDTNTMIFVVYNNKIIYSNLDILF